MFIFLIIVHVIFCFVLMIVILLQAGRGGGLTEAVGGDSMQSVLGTQAPAVLKKATAFSAIGFLCTSLLLGMVTASRGRSIFERSKLPAIPVTQERIKTVVNKQKQKIADAATQAAPKAVSQEASKAATQAAPKAVSQEASKAVTQATPQVASQDEPQSARQADTFAEVNENASETTY